MFTFATLWEFLRLRQMKFSALIIHYEFIADRINNSRTDNLFKNASVTIRGLLQKHFNLCVWSMQNFSSNDSIAYVCSGDPSGDLQVLIMFLYKSLRGFLCQMFFYLSTLKSAVWSSFSLSFNLTEPPISKEIKQTYTFKSHSVHTAAGDAPVPHLCAEQIYCIGTLDSIHIALLALWTT